MDGKVRIISLLSFVQNKVRTVFSQVVSLLEMSSETLSRFYKITLIVILSFLHSVEDYERTKTNTLMSIEVRVYFLKAIL